ARSTDILTIASVDRLTIQVSYGGTKISLKTYDVEDFPPFPISVPLDLDSECVVKGDLFIRNLVEVAPYAASEQARPVLTCICLTLGERLRLAGADGFRLGYTEMEYALAGAESGKQKLLPANVAGVLEQVWKLAPLPPAKPAQDIAALAPVPRDLKVGFKGSQAFFFMGSVTVVVHLVDGAFPNYDQLIPKHTHNYLVDPADVRRAIKSTSVVSVDASGITRFTFTEDTLLVAAQAEEKGKVGTQIKLLARARECRRIGLNSRYMLEYFQGKTHPVIMSLGEPDQPITCSSQGTPNVVIMPMFIQWEDDPRFKKVEEPKTDAAVAKASTAPTGDTAQDAGAQAGEEGAADEQPEDGECASGQGGVEDAA
ncbi:MAG: DNA polymerase III subunit beta, partial [Chloroflexota bacterium]